MFRKSSSSPSITNQILFQRRYCSYYNPGAYAGVLGGGGSFKHPPRLQFFFLRSLACQRGRSCTKIPIPCVRRRNCVNFVFFEEEKKRSSERIYVTLLSSSQNIFSVRGIRTSVLTVYSATTDCACAMDIRTAWTNQTKRIVVSMHVIKFSTPHSISSNLS